MMNKVLDDPNIPIWRTAEMYKGVNNDKDQMSTEEMSVKYGTTETRIKEIIKNKCYQN